MYKGRSIVLASILFFSGALMAQEPLDGAWTKSTIKEKDVIPYDYVREADVFWAKRIWRTIDVREKLNLPFKYPPLPLIQIIHTAAKNGELTVYDPSIGPEADQFKLVLNVDAVKNIGERLDTVTQIDPSTLEEVQVVQKNHFQ